ncbi:conserved hypothetical protein [Gloeothece citriformis PCC 7424]|uniref:Uncharacterized protein n=1 Tax=Gloeothece citriformis (strain PCC 7424) TaxID=65393 RepID=B7KEY0_GLOC7|nr:COP23 domain-containing protein [Gloeothece citriformis]ACK70436.1 conserved hypothetical protein [Gloeothece citriformis PCC 7424]
MAFDRLNVGLAIIGTMVAIAGLAYTLYRDRPPETVVSKTSRFYCELQADSRRGGKIWSVIYRHDKGFKPWLRMVREMGDEWDTQKRCEEIARRLDIFREDGLLAFDYREDSNTPRQYVLCAKTHKSGSNCPLVLTLLPKDDPYESLKEVAGALLPGTLPSYQCNSTQNCPPPKPVTISLQDQL